MRKPGALLLRVNARDNVAVALKRLTVGDRAQLEGVDVDVTELIPIGHKVALSAIPMGGDVIKYGEIIGVAISPIEAGQHVHVHNVRSARLPGAVRP